MSGAEDAIRFYDVYDEHARFESAEGQFEFARSMELLLRHLPARPFLICARQPLRLLSTLSAAPTFIFPL